jgi:hypothetical protein
LTVGTFVKRCARTPPCFRVSARWMTGKRESPAVLRDIA